MSFLTRLRDLDAKATPPPWDSDDGEGYSLLRLVSDNGDTLAHIIGDSAETETNGVLLLALRNSAARLAAVVEAGKALVEVLDQTPVYGTHNIDAWCIDRRETAYLAFRAALTALDTEP